MKPDRMQRTLDSDDWLVIAIGRMLAFGSILSFVLDRICQADPELREAVALGFDDAAGFVENIAIKLGKSASPEHTIKALGVIEEIRAATLGNNDQPKHGV